MDKSMSESREHKEAGTSGRDSQTHYSNSRTFRSNNRGKYNNNDGNKQSTNSRIGNKITRNNTYNHEVDPSQVDDLKGNEQNSSYMHERANSTNEGTTENVHQSNWRNECINKDKRNQRNYIVQEQHNRNDWNHRGQERRRSDFRDQRDHTSNDMRHSGYGANSHYFNGRGRRRGDWQGPKEVNSDPAFTNDPGWTTQNNCGVLPSTEGTTFETNEDLLGNPIENKIGNISITSPSSSTLNPHAASFEFIKASSFQLDNSHVESEEFSTRKTTLDEERPKNSVQNEFHQITQIQNHGKSGNSYKNGHNKGKDDRFGSSRKSFHPNNDRSSWNSPNIHEEKYKNKKQVSTGYTSDRSMGRKHRGYEDRNKTNKKFAKGKGNSDDEESSRSNLESRGYEDRHKVHEHIGTRQENLDYGESSLSNFGSQEDKYPTSGQTEEDTEPHMDYKELDFINPCADVSSYPILEKDARNSAQESHGGFGRQKRQSHIEDFFGQQRSGEENTQSSKIYSGGYNKSRSSYESSRRSFNMFEELHEIVANDPRGRNFVNYLKQSDREYTKVFEEEKDLFSVDKSYSLGHCVAEDMLMGSGIAVKFRSEFRCVDELLDQCKRAGELAVLERKEESRFIYYMVTKQNSTGKPTYATFWRSLVEMRNHMVKYNVEKLALPRIGCGLDRLEWKIVKPMLEFIFAGDDVEILICNFQPDEVENLNDSLLKKDTKKYCKVINETYPITSIDKGTVIIYFASEEGEKTEAMSELDKKFSFYMDFRRASRKVGEPVRFDTRNGDYVLYGCVVKKKKDDPFGFVNFNKCLHIIQKTNRRKDNQYSYVGFQKVLDSENTMINVKILNLMKYSLSNVDIYCCGNTNGSE